MIEFSYFGRPPLSWPSVGAQLGASLRWAAAGRGLDVALVLRQSDPSDLMEGLSVKAGAAGVVEALCKYVRTDFLSQAAESGSHWQTRPIVPNGLARAWRSTAEDDRRTGRSGHGQLDSAEAAY